MSLAAGSLLPISLIAKVNAAIDADAPRLVALFKNPHQHPEIAFTETRHAAIVAKNLNAMGFAVTEGISKTAVVGAKVDSGAVLNVMGKTN